MYSLKCYLLPRYIRNFTVSFHQIYEAFIESKQVIPLPKSFATRAVNRCCIIIIHPNATVDDDIFTYVVEKSMKTTTCTTN